MYPHLFYRGTVFFFDEFDPFLFFVSSLTKFTDSNFYNRFLLFLKTESNSFGRYTSTQGNENMTLTVTSQKNRVKKKKNSRKVPVPYHLYLIIIITDSGMIHGPLNVYVRKDDIGF